MKNIPETVSEVLPARIADKSHVETLAGRFCTEGPKLEFGGPMSQADTGADRMFREDLWI